MSSIFSTLGAQQVGRMPVGRTFQQGLQSIFPLNRKQGPPVPQQYSGPCPVPIDAMRTGSLSQGSKVMNADFYRDIRARTAVCPVNAAILTIKMECNGYRMQQTSTWALNNELTPRGKQKYREVFDGVNYQDFTINVVDRGVEGWECSVTRRLVSATQKNMVIIPKEPTKESYFGKCTCGLDKRDAIPCEHMAAVVVSSRIGVLTRYNIMPFWWKRVQWQEQFSRDVSAECHAKLGPTTSQTT